MTIKYIYDIEVLPNCFTISYMPFVNGDEDVKHLVLHKDYDRHTNIKTMREIVSLFEVDKFKWYIGYNSFHYDDIVMRFIIRNWKSWSAASYCREIYTMSNDLIRDKTKWNYLKYEKNSFNVIDLMKIARLNKGLKSVAANLKYHNILEFDHGFEDDLPVDRVDDLVDYNVNDVQITKELYLELQEDIQLRKTMSTMFKTNVMNEDDSGMANRLLESLYSRITHLHPSRFTYGRTPRHKIKLKDCISKSIKFKTPKMQEFLNNLKQKTIDYTDKNDKLKEQLMIGNTRYTIAKGGLHSDNDPEIYVSSDGITYKDADFSSYYPNLMLNLGVAPKHLNKGSFLKLLKKLTALRLKYKAEGNDVAAYACKILINSIYGKLGFQHHWLFDPKAMYVVTINGQLMMLMLIEQFEENGIRVVYANTDGFICKVRDDQIELFNTICRAFEKFSDLELDSEDFDKVVVRDVNNYIVKKASGKIKAKGELNADRYKDINKSFDMPIIPIAVQKYFLEGIPVEETIFNHDDQLDFCYVPGSGRKFDIVHYYIEDGQMHSEKIQRTNRIYVARSGGNIVKQSINNPDREISLISGEHVALMNKVREVDNIKYPYYINKAQNIVNTIDNRQLSFL